MRLFPPIPRVRVCASLRLRLPQLPLRRVRAHALAFFLRISQTRSRGFSLLRCARSCGRPHQLRLHSTLRRRRSAGRPLQVSRAHSLARYRSHHHPRARLPTRRPRSIRKSTRSRLSLTRRATERTATAASTTSLRAASSWSTRKAYLPTGACSARSLHSQHYITQDDPHNVPDFDIERRLQLKTYTEVLHELSQISRSQVHRFPRSR